VLICCVNIEWLNAQGQTMQKTVYKKGEMRILRNGVRELVVEVAQHKLSSTQLKLKDINVFKKFINEGKASIKFNSEKAQLFISNAPTASLMLFLRTMYIKLTKDNEENKGVTKEEMHKKLRAHLLSEKSSQLDEISPVTNAELDRAKKMAVSKSTITTPSPPASRKRRLLEATPGDNPKAAKQLYAQSPLAKKAEPSKIELNPDDPAMMETMNEEQTQILQACLGGKNVFFTGSAGTGKSFLLRKIIATLPPDGTVATASTGVAACLIGGVTLHSFAGIGAGDHGLKRSVELASRPAAAQAWRRCKRLIIDEISMVDVDFFDVSRDPRQLKPLTKYCVF